MLTLIALVAFGLMNVLVLLLLLTLRILSGEAYVTDFGIVFGTVHVLAENVTVNMMVVANEIEVVMVRGSLSAAVIVIVIVKRIVVVPGVDPEDDGPLAATQSPGVAS